VDEKVSRLADNLMRQATPPAWQKVWEGPEEPAEYIKAIGNIIIIYNIIFLSTSKIP